MEGFLHDLNKADGCPNNASSFLPGTFRGYQSDGTEPPLLTLKLYDLFSQQDAAITRPYIYNITLVPPLTLPAICDLYID